ncbi:MAG: NAD(P)/FAD-dependent oxidoreductase [Methanobrevibacter olleyae]|uniref:NAD(P)/FAD-dependent oxidoreductase n=1 Tax=Methanobrevibacter olleyae TaxID=294671 RepID=A0A8T3VMF3_METOL|nr:NAD(P)/FAD-dependent oxidoreductase [Methanobrevibacter olleyae]
MSFDYDVTIIGAGPIGSTLAYELSKEDVNVCLIDKKKLIGLPLQCAGIINKRVLDINQFPEELILNKVKGAVLHSKNHSLSVSKEEDQALIIDRVALDQFLFNRAIENGAHFHLSSKVVAIDDMEGKVSFQNESTEKSIKSKIIVGADGPLSIISSAIGNDLKFYCASQYLVKVNEDNNNMPFVDLYAYGDLFPGFIWQIPVDKNIYRIGLFSNHDYKRQNEILDDFLENDFKFDDYEIIEKYKGKIPIYNKDNKLFKNRALLIGDAASQIKPTTGGGLLIGFEAVEMAKNAILKALNSKDFNLINLENETHDDSKILRDCLKSYQKDFEERFLKEFSYQFKVQKTLSTLSDDDLDYFFEKLNEKEADKLISEYGDMDNQSILVKEFLKRGLVLSLLPSIHKKKLAKIWLL